MGMSTKGHGSIDTVRPSAYPCRPSGNKRLQGLVFATNIQHLKPPLRGTGKGYETHISAQQAQARSHSRFPCPHGDEGRASGPEAPSRQRPCAVDSVTLPASVNITSSSENRFPKDSRLLDAAAFGRVFEKATRSRDALFTVLCRRNDADRARLGLAIARKHCRRATARNRIKRLIRESFRQQQELLSGLDVVVMNKPAAADASNREILDSLERHWTRCSKARTREHRTDG